MLHGKYNSLFFIESSPEIVTIAARRANTERLQNTAIISRPLQCWRFNYHVN